MLGREKLRRRDLSFVQALIGWTTLILVLTSALALGANRPVFWIALSIAILPLFSLQVLFDFIREPPNFAKKVWPPALLFLAALIWGVVQTMPNIAPGLAHPVWDLVPDAEATISADPLSGQHHIMRLATYAMIFWISIRAAAVPGRAMAFLIAIAVFSNIMAAFGIWAYWSGQNPIVLEYARPVVSASFASQNSYATYAIFGIITNLAVYLHLSALNRSDGAHGERSIERLIERFFTAAWIFGLGIFLCWGALLLTLSRAGTVAGLIALVTFIAFYRQRGDRMYRYILILTLSLLATFAIVMALGLSDRLFQPITNDVRFTVFPLIIDGIMERPYLGHGLGAFQDTFGLYASVQIADGDWDYAHNSYLESLYELGIPAGAAFYAALLWIGLVIACGCIARQRNRNFACVALACIAGVGSHALFDFGLQMPATAALFSIILGIGWAQSFPEPSRNS